jgi:23S rRNA (pseudouridine1915-N3)-methyltransferase
LHPEGTHIDSLEWSRKFASFGARLTFVIGGAEGIPPHILQKASFQWSLSKLTFTHQITRLLLLEQLYRALEIQKGSGYHK